MKLPKKGVQMEKKGSPRTEPRGLPTFRGLGSKDKILRVWCPGNQERGSFKNKRVVNFVK